MGHTASEHIAVDDLVYVCLHAIDLRILIGDKAKGEENNNDRAPYQYPEASDIAHMEKAVYQYPECEEYSQPRCIHHDKKYKDIA